MYVIYNHVRMTMFINVYLRLFSKIKFTQHKQKGILSWFG